LIRPWLKFYVADWRDKQLRRCSLSARGLWIDLMTYMHEAEPYGHLVFEGGDMPIDELALQLARPVAEVKKAMSELEKHGVFSRTEDGIIYSRRMVRDNLREQQDRENGKGGGNPKLKSAHNGGVNPPLKPPDNGEDKAQWNIVSSSSSATSLDLEETQEEQASGRRKPKTQLPAIFNPDRELPRSMGWPESRINQEIQRFFDYAKAHKKTYADWNAAWRNWCRSPLQMQPTQRVNGNGRSILDAIDKLPEGDADQAPSENPFLSLPKG